MVSSKILASITGFYITKYQIKLTCPHPANFLTPSIFNNKIFSVIYCSKEKRELYLKNKQKKYLIPQVYLCLKKKKNRSALSQTQRTRSTHSHILSQ